MIFLWLALLALVFALLGFLVHAFYFGRKEEVESLRKEVEGLKLALSLAEKENAESQAKILEAEVNAAELEMLLKQKNLESDRLLFMPPRQEEIQISQKATAETRVPAAPEQPRSESAPLEAAPKPEAPAQDSRETKIPLWKDNLNNILGVLEKIEKSTKE